ncbi:MAG TPA: OmpA family protein [Cyclobacteriaceae bacterium]|jgi:outer membrane protein OmpA-like peptidoglycan-associated protein|nr:OmpA family protein [Cyclobacteriaceae bacterium]HRF34456.1 OmpA family protein [Cyclobacteriaceae bacterium]
MRPFFYLAVFIFCSPWLMAQEKPHTDQSLYVVIGAFGVPRNAIEFTENARKQGFPAQFELNPKRKLFYVYILHTEDRKEAITETIKQQKQSPFHDTWMYQGLLGDNPQVVKISETERKQVIEALVDEKKITPADTIKQVSISTPTVTEVKSEKPIDKPEEKSITPLAPANSRTFLFRITALADQDTLAGDVDVFDADATAAKKRKMATYRGNDAVTVKSVNKSGNMVLECEVFGYRKLQVPLNFNNPDSVEGVTIENNVIQVPFELVRLQKGDKAIMFNVYFYKDAAVMRPESRYEVNSLLEMMNENPDYKIVIHGHTNGNAAGKIISLGASKNFFQLTTDNKEGRGSAKKLSEERALLLKQFLIENKVSADRIQVKAWGGNQPIYDVDHASAHANVRVEIEILED